MSILWGRGDMSENTAVSFLQRTFVLKSCPYGIVYKKKKKYIPMHPILFFHLHFPHNLHFYDLPFFCDLELKSSTVTGDHLGNNGRRQTRT
jgi:hypothetical protein